LAAPGPTRIALLRFRPAPTLQCSASHPLVLGGSWLAALASDLGNGKFDGANLIANFDNLNPGNTFFSKLHNVYKAVDTEGPRFLGFEKWWGDFIRLNGDEILYPVNEHFIGNKLTRNEIATADGRLFDIRNVRTRLATMQCAALRPARHVPLAARVHSDRRKECRPPGCGYSETLLPQLSRSVPSRGMPCAMRRRCLQESGARRRSTSFRAMSKNCRLSFVCDIRCGP